MSEENSEKPREPSYEELADLVARQRKGIIELHELVERQEVAIAQLQEAVNSGRRWKPKGGAAHISNSTALGVRTEAILRMAEQESEDFRAEARRAAAQHIALAEQEAARIRAAARGDGILESTPESVPEPTCPPEI
jgi:cell division septum initiation protein DivIVA